MTISASIHFEELVGRRAELTFLLEQQAQVANGRGTVVLLGGEPGIGKTRLIAEFCKRLEMGQNWHTIGSCLEFVQAPYLPFVEIFDHLFGADTNLAAGGEYPAWRPESRDLSLQNLASSSESGQKLQIFTAVAQRLGELSKVRPVVAIIEDLQWADNATLELLEYLIVPLAKSRVFLLASYRSETAQQRHWPETSVARLERKGAFRVHLNPLSEADSRRLVHQGLQCQGPLSKEAIDRVLELAEGNPLFIEELLRSAMDGRAELHLTSDATSPSLRGAVLERAEQLTKNQQRILTLAAVIGRSFDPEFVARIAGSSLDHVCETLRRARQLQIVRQDQRDFNRYEFRHALTRHILYSELLPAQTLVLHAKIAAELDQRDGHIVELAYHWAAAGETEKAVCYNERGGDQAAAIDAYRDAARLYRRALDFLTQSGAERANLCNKLADSLYLGGLPESATPWYEESLKQYVRLKDHEKQARLLLSLARQCWVAANTESAVPLIERAIQVADTLPSSTLKFESRVKMASYCNLLGKHEQAEEHLTAAERLGADPTPAYYNTRAITYGHTGRVFESFMTFRRAARSAEARDDVYLLTVALDDFANVATALGRIRSALRLRQQALSVAVKRGVLWRSAYLSLRQASTLMLIGNFRGAKEIVNRTFATGTESAGVRLLSAAVGIPLGLKTEDDELLKFCIDAGTLELALRSAEPDRVGAVSAAFAELYRSRGHITEAKHIVRQALRALNTAHQAWDLLLVAASLSDDADVRRARALLEREASIPAHELSKACLSLFEAIVAQRQRRRLQAMKSAKVSADLFKSMGLLPYLAHALELSDSKIEALKIYHDIGDVRNERRLNAEANNNRRRGRAGTALTPRENDIATLVVDGYTNREIAFRLKISENTVEHHLDSIFNRLGIRSRSRLAAIMAEHHLEHRLSEAIL